MLYVKDISQAILVISSSTVILHAFLNHIYLLPATHTMHSPATV